MKLKLCVQRLIAYGFNYLQAGTRTPEYEVVTELKGGRLWAEDKDSVETRPHVSDSEAIHYAFGIIDRGSTFTIKFGADQARPRDLNWISATSAEQWRAILLLKTPLGQISHDGNADDGIRFDLRVVDVDGIVTELKNQEAKYLYPHLVIGATADLKPILVEQQRRVAKNLGPQKISTKYTNLNGIHHTWDTDALKELIRANWDKRPEFVELIDKYAITAYAFFCYTVKIWDSFNDNTMRLRKGLRIMRGGLQMATDRMLQGDMILIPLTSNIGNQNQSHVVIHFTNADPDLGRKGFQPELREVAESISVSIVNHLRQWRSLLKKDTGAAPSIVSETELDTWIQDQVVHEKKSPLAIKSKHFFAPNHELSIASTPRCEQDVIVLFNQLVAGGVIRGLRMLAASQVTRYDAVFRYVIRPPESTHIFDKQENPLGVQELPPGQSVGFASRAQVLEYKFSVDGLIHDFESGEKQERDVNLVVAWEIGSDWQQRYSVTSLLDLDNVHLRQCHGITHAFHDTNAGDLRFYAVILSELVAYLNDIDGVQAYHRRVYGGAAV